jgi:hypothetical protein
MSDRRVHVYEYGEASGDLRAAFYVDELSYEDPQLARTVLEIADATMTRLGVVYSVEVTSGPDARVPYGVPTWEEFRQRHFVEGMPLPVRPAPRDVVEPSSWHSMSRSVETSHRRFRDDLIAVLTAAFPDGSVSVRSDPGPLLRGPASIDRSEEWYGFEVALRVNTAGLPPTTALEQVTAALRDQGWQGDTPHGSTTEVTRDHYRLWIQAKPGYLLVEGESPLYRAPTDPGSSIIVEPRPAQR